MSIRKLLIVTGVIVVFAGGLFAGRQLAKMGSTDSPGTGPAATSSYTLEDIWKRLDDGTPGSPGAFAEPSGDPTSGTMHTLYDIMTIAPERDNLGATAADVLDGKAFWGLTAGAWGLQVGTLASPAGPAPIPKTGQDECFDDSDTAQPCPVAGFPRQDGELQWGVDWPSPRFTDNNDGTITDNLTGLMWTEDGNHGAMTWEQALAYCAVYSHSGHSDWRLPNVRELYSLINSGEFSDQWLISQGFSDVDPVFLYWTSTTLPGLRLDAFGVQMMYGLVDHKAKDFGACMVWPVRGP